MKKIIDSINLEDKNNQRRVVLILSYLLSMNLAFLVYFTGGTAKVYANLMYLPIVLNASISNHKHSFWHALFTGLLIGPFMPLNAAEGTMQSPENWIIRIAIYITVALIISFMVNHYLEEYKEKITKEEKLLNAHSSMLFALVKLSESRDQDTGEHLNRVSEYCSFLAKELSKTEKYKNYIDHIEKAAPLHDIGKVNIPDEILLKPGKLNEEEFDVMKKHSNIGADLLLKIKEKYKDNKFLDMGECVVRYHHEKWNGKGYPKGLKEENIPLSARIMAVVDVYDALRSKRPYKEPYSHKKTVKIIKEGKAEHFDPFLIDIFLDNHEKIKNLYEF
jgi:HD-GYP domain-containing protein (c-di-GMP phosphodiesterase class II)